MDAEPFLEFDIENIKDYTLNELRKFHKTSFDIDKIIDSASELKYSIAIKEILKVEFENPSEEFVKFFTKQIYKGKQINKKVLDQFTVIVQKSINQTFKDVVNERLQSALSKDESNVEEEIVEESKIVTTDEEVEAFHIVRSIIRTKVEVKRIIARDTQSYYGILLDDNNRKPICRLHLNGSNKYIGLFDQNKNEERILLNNIDEIYVYTDRLLNTISLYE